MNLQNRILEFSLELGTMGFTQMKSTYCHQTKRLIDIIKEKNQDSAFHRFAQ